MVGPCLQTPQGIAEFILTMPVILVLNCSANSLVLMSQGINGTTLPGPCDSPIVLLSHLTSISLIFMLTQSIVRIKYSFCNTGHKVLHELQLDCART